MPLHVSWQNDDKAIVHIESAGEWTWEEYHQALEQIVVMMRSVPHRVDLILYRRSDSVHPRGSGLPHYQRAMRMLPDNIGLNIAINTNPMARAIVAIFTKLYGSKARGQITLVASLDDAYALIARDRAQNAARE